MLLARSSLFKVCFVVVLSQVGCQSYEYGNEDGDEHADVREDDGEHYEHPDYSKYYSVDGAAPLTANSPSTGFVSSSDFEGFFGGAPIVFGASNNQQIKKPSNIFVPQSTPQQPQFQTDYFEAAQNKQNKAEDADDDEYAPTKYISHNLPKELLFESEDSNEQAREEDAEEIDIKKHKKHDDDEYDDEKQRKPYSSGKSQYPAAAGYATAGYATTATPYQKYSFQPTKSRYLQSLVSTAAPFNPSYTKHTSVPVFESQATDTVPEKYKGCKKLRKPVSHDDTMNCFVCEDPGNKSKFTQCSYSNEPKPLDYYQGHSERYSTPGKSGDGFRYKRYSETEDDSDPYEYVKKRSQKLNAAKNNEDDFEHLFQYSPDFDTEPLSYSEKQSEEIKKNPDNCQKIDKDGMTCTVCKNAKTGGNFEQCSYTSEPKDQKYAYVTNKKYNSNDEQPEEEESKTVELQSKKKTPPEVKQAGKQEYGSKVVKTTKTKDLEANNQKSNRRGDRFSRRRGEETKHNLKNKEKPSDNKKEATKDEEDYAIPRHFIESTEAQADDKKEKSDDKDGESSFADFEDYHYKIFPEAEESKQQEFTATKSKHDVEEVLAEFTKKDRSKCKKAEKKGMTCYLCKDEKNIQHEECMYVSEPQKSHVAYHGVQHLKKKNGQDAAESKAKAVVSKIGGGKATASQQAAASQQLKTYVKYKDAQSSPSDKQSEKVDAEEESDRTKAEYNEQYGVVLPRYMAEISNYEKEFDASAEF